MNDILDVFYNEVIPEASKGKVEAYFTYNILFNTILNGKVITTSNIEDMLIPTLIIDNPKEFNKLLLEYILIAYEFYYDNYINKIEENDPNFNKNYLKSLLSLLWSNATNEDFLHPCEYINKRISFFKMESFKEEYDTSLGRVVVELKKDSIGLETPYCLDISINENTMPKVNLGIFNDNAYIYAIQNTSKESRDKQLNRGLYKVNEGIDLDKEENDNIEHPENLKGITPATLVSADIAIAYLKKLGISKISIPTFLISRWNAKDIANERKAKDEKVVEELKEKQESIQRNVTDKYIRTFRRLAYHFDNIDVVAYPYMEDTNMHLYVSDNMECNNPLLKELYNEIIGSNLDR